MVDIRRYSPPSPSREMPLILTLRLFDGPSERRYSRSYLMMTVFSASKVTVLVTGAPFNGTILTS